MVLAILLECAQIFPGGKGVKASTRIVIIHSSPLRPSHSHALSSLTCNTYLLAYGPRSTPALPPSLLAPKVALCSATAGRAVSVMRGRPPPSPRLGRRGLVGFGFWGLFCLPQMTPKNELKMWCVTLQASILSPYAYLDDANPPIATSAECIRYALYCTFFPGRVRESRLAPR